MYGFCRNPEDHEREGRNDYERKGYADSWKYNDHFNDCNMAYTKGYDEAERAEERRREIREEENRQEQHAEQRRRERQQQMEEIQNQNWEYNEQQRQYQVEMEAEYGKQEPPQQFPDDDLPF